MDEKAIVGYLRTMKSRLTPETYRELEDVLKKDKKPAPKHEKPKQIYIIGLRNDRMKRLYLKNIDDKLKLLNMEVINIDRNNNMDDAKAVIFFPDFHHETSTLKEFYAAYLTHKELISIEDIYLKLINLTNK